jgi:hypothetical protein
MSMSARHVRMATYVASVLAGCSWRAPEPPALPAPFPDVTADHPPPPISGGTLLVLAGGTSALAADPDRDRLFFADLSGLERTAEIALRPDDEPGRAVEDGAGRVHVVLRRGGAVVTVAPGPWSIQARRDVCAAPRGIAYQAASDRLYIACAGGELVSLAADPQAAMPARTVALEPDLRDVVVRGDRLLVSRFRTAEVLVVSAAGQVQDRLRPRARRDFRGSSAGRMEPREPGVAWRMVPFGPADVAILHQQATSTEVVTGPSGWSSGGQGCSGGELVQTVVSPLLGAGAPLAIGGASMTVDVAVAPDGSRLVAVSAGNAHRPGAPKIHWVWRQELEGAPEGACTGGLPRPAGAPDAGADAEEPVDSIADPEGEAVAVAFTPAGQVVVQTRQPAALEVVTMRPPRRIVLSASDRTDTGHMIFHAAGTTGLACASCHPEGGEDGRVWRFRGLGARRTQSLRGGVMATAPFHWGGEMATMSDLLTEIFERRMSGPPLTAADRQALGRWVDTVPLLPRARPADPDAAARGEQLFRAPAIGCATCHQGTATTNNLTMDVGTGGPLQVPSLRGLRWRAPLMHDGCAPTIAARFLDPRCGGGDRHGGTAALTPGQQADLVAYLETL